MHLTGLQLTEVQMESIPAEDLLPVIAMIYLIAHESLKLREASIILKSVKDAELNNIPEEIEYPANVDLRLLRVTCLASSFCHFFKNCLNSIGFIKDKFVMHLDGVHCQKLNLVVDQTPEVGPEKHDEILNQLLKNI